MTIRRRKIVDGEILIKKTVDKKGKFPLKLQVIKPDMLSQYLLRAPKTNHVIRSGIELDDHLKPLAFWIDKKTPDGFVQYDPDRMKLSILVDTFFTRKLFYATA